MFKHKIYKFILLEIVMIYKYNNCFTGMKPIQDQTWKLNPGKILLIKHIVFVLRMAAYVFSLHILIIKCSRSKSWQFGHNQCLSADRHDGIHRPEIIS